MLARVDDGLDNDKRCRRVGEQHPQLDYTVGGVGMKPARLWCKLSHEQVELRKSSGIHARTPIGYFAAISSKLHIQ